MYTSTHLCDGCCQGLSADLGQVVVHRRGEGGQLGLRGRGAGERYRLGREGTDSERI